MAKKIAVVVWERQGESLRMSVGITVMDDIIDVFVLDKKIEPGEENDMNLEMIAEMGLKLYTNIEGVEGMEYLSTEAVAKKLLEYDSILAY